MKKLALSVLLRSVERLGCTLRYQRQIKLQGPLVRVLCLHDVPQKEWCMEFLATITSNYHVLTCDEFNNQHFHPEKINLLLTFDDGYQSWVDIVLPCLQEYSLNALFFVNSGLLDVHDDEAAQRMYVREQLLLTNPRETLSASGLTQLLEAGHAVGGHTVNHVRATHVPAEVFEREVVDDKQRLEEISGSNVHDFAYPFGTMTDFSTTHIKMVKERTYTRQYSAVSGFFTKGTEPIKRTLVDCGERMEHVTHRIEGSYDVVKKIIRI